MVWRNLIGLPYDGAVCGASLDIVPPSSFSVTMDINDQIQLSFPGSLLGTIK
ncbi:MAG TPA: hypothetical protein VFG45_10480 [Candidatus Nitrosocosmicus sp.]|nr:hypothetical protein [Candidatus Nitrosocosmicus sp.]